MPCKLLETSGYSQVSKLNFFVNQLSEKRTRNLHTISFLLLSTHGKVNFSGCFFQISLDIRFLERTFFKSFAVGIISVVIFLPSSLSDFCLSQAIQTFKPIYISLLCLMFPSDEGIKC